MTKKYRIQVAENLNRGSTSYSPIDIDTFDELVLYLKNEKTIKVSLKYQSIMDDIPDFHEMGLSIDDFKQKHFDWLVEKNKWQSRYIEIDAKNKQL